VSKIEQLYLDIVKKQDRDTKLKITFITWTPYTRRSEMLAKELGAILHFIHYLKFRDPLYAPAKYLLQSVKTLLTLVKERPAVIFVMNPPIFCVLVVFLYATLHRARYVIDSHTGAFDSRRWKWSLFLHRFLSRRAITTIVTNEHLKSFVNSWSANAFVLTDAPIQFPEGKATKISRNFNIVVINTFSSDEPVKEILGAAKLMSDINFYITGDVKYARGSYFRSNPTNVVFTGFLPEAKYINLLRSADAIMVLTTNDHTFQCGALEAMSIGKPIITSDWKILRDYFNKGTIYVDNTVTSIARGIKRVRAEKEKLHKEIVHLREERCQEWRKKFDELKVLLANYESS